MTTVPLWKPELLERERELAELASLAKEARGGAGGTVLIEARAGLGKTRLLERLRGHAARAGMRVLSARATELEREFPYGVVRQLFEPLLARGDDRALMEGPAAAARPAFGLGGEGVSTPDDLSFATLYGLYWLTVNVSHAEPLLLAVDDAHWADTPSLEFLMFLAPRLEELPILLAVACRPLKKEGPLAGLGTDPSTLRISPGPLGPQSAAKLLAAALRSPPDPAFSSASYELTGGNPFLLTELVRALGTEDVQPTAANAPVLRELVPDTIARAVLLRLAPLPAVARDLARAIAILGDGCELRLAAALAGVDPSTAAEAADALRRADILEAEPPLRFVHPLIGNALYAEIPAGARSREHERAAALLAEEGMPPERSAIHLLATDPAGDPRIVQTLCGAARAALDQGAPQPAVAYLRRALDEPPPADGRPDVLELFLTAALRAADASAVEPFEAELREAITADPDRLMRSGPELAMGMMGVGQVDEAASILERAIDAAERAGDLGLAVALEAQLISFTQLPPGRARARFERYDGRLAEGSPEDRLVLALRSWWSSLLGGRASEAGELARRAVADGRIFPEQPESPVPGQAVLVLARADDIDAAEEAAERMIATARARGSVTGLTIGWFVRGYTARRRGDLRSAEADARQGVDVGRLQRGFLAAVTLYTALLVDVLIERDELEAAEHELSAIGMTGEIPDGYWLGPVLFSRGRLRLAQGRMRESADDLLELRERMARWEIDGNAGSPASAYAALALAALGDRERARMLADEELVRARRWGAASTVAEALAALGVATGGERGIEQLGEAARLAEATPARLLHAAMLTELGAALRRERRPADAREPLREALDLARRCGGVAIARRAAHELEATGEKVERHTPIGVDALTPSERRVAEMAARGMTNRQIAAALYVTIKTVESHLRAAYDKLGIGSRRELRDAL